MHAVASASASARAPAPAPARPSRPARAGARATPASRRSVRCLLSARDNPNFDPNDPMTWGKPSDDDSVVFEDLAAPVDDIMQLSDEQLGQLLGAEGATVPAMLDDAQLAAAFAAAGEGDEEEDARPETAAEGIDAGLKLYRAGSYPEALAAFTDALDLPGTGPVRSRKALVAPAGPSRGYNDASVSLNEQIAIHYNCACCHARMEDPQSGLVSLVRAMEAGYDDYDNVRSDPDIAPLRADARFEGIMARFEPKGVLEGVFAMLSKGTTREQMKSGGAPKGGGGGALVGGLIDKVKDSLGK